VPVSRDASVDLITSSVATGDFKKSQNSMSRACHSATWQWRLFHSYD